MATLRNVAAAAGVHVATASAVLNPAGGNTRVSEETRQRVLAVAQKLAYVPNETARRLRTGQSNVVAFLGGDLRNPFFAELATALERELARLDLQMLVSHVTQAEPEVIARNIASLRQQNVKSIICWAESAVSAQPRKSAEGVWLDLEYAIQSAVKEMIRRGFRKIGFYFPKSQRESPSASARSQAFLSVCRELALPRPVLAAYEGESWDLFASIQGAKEVLRSHPGIQAWIGFNDIAGLGLLRSLPQNKSDRVLCFDGTILARSWPGNPTYLDLKVPELAQTVASVVAGELDIKLLGCHENWLRPCLKK